MLVTSTMAKEWLRHNVGNRPLRRATVEVYLAEMKAGRWRQSTDAIGINTKGELVNGQHRLTAVMQSGVACWFSVSFDVEDGAKEVIDVGCARTVSDTLKMLYGVERARMITGAIRQLDDFVHNRRLKLFVGHAVERLERYEPAFRWVTKALPAKRAISSSPVVAALVYAHRTAPAEVEEFTTGLVSGLDLRAGSPIWVLRERLNKHGNGQYREGKHEMFLLVLDAISHYIQKKSCRSLKVREDLIDHFGAAYEQRPRKAA
jgi:hypothetical protein